MRTVPTTNREIAQHHEVAEFVLPGHPDKLCDAAVDAIVDWVGRRAPGSQCGLEAACIFDTMFLTGRIATYDPGVVAALTQGGVQELVRNAYHSAGYGADDAGFLWGPAPDTIRVVSDGVLRIGLFEDGERELRHLSDDQAICVGHAVRSPQTNHLPPAHWLARQIGRELHRLRAERGAGHVGPDAKVIVHVVRSEEPEDFRPARVSISLNHHQRSDWLLLRSIAEEAVESACSGLQLPDLELNGAGMFVCGGPNGDNGLSGKKLVVDAYGPGVPIGGGAWSGKDLYKVDRLGGMAARRLALESLLASDAQSATVTLHYHPGGDRPASISLLLDGRPADRVIVPAECGQLESERLHRVFSGVGTSLVELARWGHQTEGAPWELPGAAAARAGACPALPSERGRPACSRASNDLLQPRRTLATPIFEQRAADEEPFACRR